MRDFSLSEDGAEVSRTGEKIITDGLKLYPTAMCDLGNLDHRIMGQWKTNRAENSHLRFRRREHAMLRFRQTETLHKFAPVHALFYKNFNSERHEVDRQIYKRIRARLPWLSGKIPLLENKLDIAILVLFGDELPLD